MVYVPPRAAFLVLSAIICHLAKKISYLCITKNDERLAMSDERHQNSISLRPWVLFFVTKRTL